MGGGVHVGVHADGKAGLHAAARGHGVDQRQFRFRLAIEAVDAARERVFHFGRGLAHAGENHLGRIAAGLEHAKQFAAGNDVEARAGFGQQRQHGQRRVGLHGVADGVRQFAEGFVVRPVVSQQRLAGVHVGRGAHAGGQIGQRHLLAIEIVLGIGKHRGWLGKTQVCHAAARFSAAT